MAAFGSFAGLATAGVGALCGYETYALSMFDFPATSSNSCGGSSLKTKNSQQSTQVITSTENSSAIGSKMGEGPTHGHRSDGGRCLETLLLTCCP